MSWPTLYARGSCRRLGVRKALWLCMMVLLALTTPLQAKNLQNPTSNTSSETTLSETDLSPRDPNLLPYDPTDSIYQTGLLWRLSRDGQKRGYVFGTVHTSDPRIMDVAPAVQSYIHEMDAICPELELSSPDLLLLSRQIVYSDKTTLVDVIGPTLFNQAAKILLTSNIPRAYAIKLKPWAVVMLLSVPKEKSQQVLDLTLIDYARKSGQSILPLETMAEQLAAFETTTLDDQISLLKDTITQHPDIKTDFDQLLDGYLRQNLLVTDDLMDQKVSHDVRAVDRLMNRLVVKRNRTIVERADKILADSSCFIAIGMMHLPGSQGVLNLFAERGWQVERVKEFSPTP